MVYELDRAKEVTGAHFKMEAYQDGPNANRYGSD
jgi:hypothetical protein